MLSGEYDVVVGCVGLGDYLVVSRQQGDDLVGWRFLLCE